MSLSSVDLLVLGAGWTGTFLLPHLAKAHPDIAYAATTRDGRDNTIAWTWDEHAEGSAQFEQLPTAKTVLIVFPIKVQGGSRRLVEGYEQAHGAGVRFIQLGSTGIFDGGPTLQGVDLKPHFKWTDRHSPYALDNPRAMAEDELLSIRQNTFVLNLSGLWGGERDPLNWIPRVAPTKEALATKNSVHLIHGLDVARAIIAVHLSPSPTATPLTLQPDMTNTALDTEKSHKPKLLGKRYVLTDLRVYCWFDLIMLFGQGSNHASAGGVSAKKLLEDQLKWVVELMDERGIRALPRTPEQLGRAIDSREFWTDFGVHPTTFVYSASGSKSVL